ncbi:MAG: hypothetical protein ACOYNI_06160 [Acidimicrobiia bacterium]
MAIPVLLILAALWAAVLVPPLVRARAERGLGGLPRGLGGLGSARPTALTRPLAGPVRPIGAAHPYAVGFARAKAMTPVQRRRRDVLVALAGAAGFFSLVALVMQSVLTMLLALVCVGALIAYCAALVQLKQQRIAARAEQAANLERAVKVRYLPTRRSTVPAAMLRRTASSH